MMPRGAGRLYVSTSGYNRSSRDWSRMRRERSLKHDDGSSEPFLIARTAVTSADTRVDSSKVRVRLWIREEISSLFTLDHLSSPSDAAAAADDDGDALNATCVIFLRQRPVPCYASHSAAETPVRIEKMQDCLCFSSPKKFFMGITTHHSHCGNKINRQLNQQYGCVCALPSLQKWIWSVAGLLTVRIEACRNREVNDISGREVLQ